MSNWDAFLQDARIITWDAIRNFSFSSYGLDDLDPAVNPDLSDEWVGDLGAEIVAALDNLKMLSGRVLKDDEYPPERGESS